MDIQTRLFGETKEGAKVYEYTLMNEHHCSVSIINYGGIIRNITVPDKRGQLANVVLGFNTVKEYEEESPYFGAIVGRVAGRIGNATFTLGDKTYPLAKNDGANCLHGGIKGFDKAIWTVEQEEYDDRVSIILSYLSKDLEEGFPGNLDVSVTYTWTNNNELTITYKGTTDKETPITLTNHSYFNLSGNLSTEILDHDLLINASQYVELGTGTLPVNIVDVKNTPFDFNRAKNIGQDIDAHHPQIKIAGGYDHPFVVNKSAPPHAALSHPTSGRQLEVTTDEAVIVCYTGNYLSKDIKVFDNEALSRRSAICLEPQYYPNNMAFDRVPTKTLKPGEHYHSATIYKFGLL